MAANVPNFTYESSVSRIRIGASAIPCTKLTPPKQNVKLEMLGRVGENIKTIRTIGVLETGDAQIEMESAVFSNLLLPALPTNGFTLFEFSVHVVQRHPLVNSPFYALWQRVRFIGTEEEAIEHSEKATKMVLPVSVIQVLYAGADGVYKTLVLQQGLPPPILAQFTL